MLFERQLGIFGTAGRVFAITMRKNGLGPKAVVGRKDLLVNPNQTDRDSAREEPKFPIYNFQFTNWIKILPLTFHSACPERCVGNGTECSEESPIFYLTIDE
jgi:hypothetical protein